jgi:aryl-alcohol dehydrogenase-like predicted oxidoreductase
MQQEGLIKHLGLSTVNAEQIAEAQAIAPIVEVQNFYNIARRDDDDLIDALARQGLPTCPTSPSAGSLRCNPTRCRRSPRASTPLRRPSRWRGRCGAPQTSC